MGKGLTHGLGRERAAVGLVELRGGEATADAGRVVTASQSLTSVVAVHDSWCWTATRRKAPSASRHRDGPLLGSLAGTMLPQPAPAVALGSCRWCLGLTSGLLAFSSGVLRFSSGVLGFSSGVLGFSSGVLGFSFGVLGLALGS